MRMYRQFIRHMWRRDRMLPNLDLDSLISVGTVGRLRRGVFTFRDTLRDHGIEFDTRSSTTVKEIRVDSSSGVEVKVKAAGQVLQNSNLPDAEAGVNVRFTRGGRFLFHANGGREDQLQNLTEIGHQISALARQGKWERDWFIVTKARRVSSATLLVSSSSEGTVDLKAKAASTNLGEADVAFDVFFKRDMSSATLVHGIGDDPTICATFRVAGLRSKTFTDQPIRSVERPRNGLRALGSFDRPEDFDDELVFAELGLDDIDDDLLDEDEA